MQWWMRPGNEPRLGEQEARAARAEQVLGRDAHALVEDLGVAAEAAEVLGGVLHRRHVAQDPHARRVGRDDDHRRALVRAVSGSVTAMTMRKSATEAFVENHLWPSMTHSPVALVEHGARLERRRVGAGDAGLGHRERRAQVAGEQRVQPAVLLLLGAGERDELGVAGVRRLVAERARRVRRRAEDLVHEPELDLAEALAAELGRQVRGPQPARADLAPAAGAARGRAAPGRGRASPAARSPRGRTAPSSPAAPGTRARWRSPTPSCRPGYAVAPLTRFFVNAGMRGAWCSTSRSSRAPPQRPSRSTRCARACSPSSPSRRRRRSSPSASACARQKVNYHLRLLESHGLVREAETRRHGGLTERLLVATASSFVVSPAALGASRLRPAPARATACRRATSSRSRRGSSARSARWPATTTPHARCRRSALDTEIALRSPAERAAFADDLAARGHPARGDVPRPRRAGRTGSSSPPTPFPDTPRRTQHDRPRDPTPRSRCPARPSRSGTRSPPAPGITPGSCPTRVEEREGGEIVHGDGRRRSARPARSPRGSRRTASSTRRAAAAGGDRGRSRSRPSGSSRRRPAARASCAS